MKRNEKSPPIDPPYDVMETFWVLVCVFFGCFFFDWWKELEFPPAANAPSISYVSAAPQNQNPP